MADKPEAFLGGYPLIMEGASIEWTLKPGVQPNVGTFQMHPADAEAVVTGKPVSLEIRPLLGNAVKIDHLWALRILPGPNANISLVEVYDRRWFWALAHVERHYNKLRATGFKRVQDNVAQLVGLADRAPQLDYARYSMTPAKWIALSMMTDVLSEVAKIERDYWGQSFDAVLDKRIVDAQTNLPIQEVDLGDPGDIAIARALANLPEADITVDYDGKVIVFSRAAGDEIGIVDALRPEIFGKGHVDLVKNALIRPKEIHVLFTRRLEVRFDFIEVATATTGTQTVVDEPLVWKRQMENVLPLPDFATDGAGGRPSKLNGRIVPQSTWITFDDYFRILPKVTIGGISRSIDHDILQRAFIPQMDLWSAMQLTGTVADAVGGSLPNWIGRIGAFKQHYRQTFRLNRLWVDNFLTWDVVRVATIDPQSGQRAPSMAYGDYAILPSQKSNIRSLAQGYRMDYAINRTAFSGGDLDSSAETSPAVVDRLDEDQGIVRVNYMMDQMQSYEQVLPSQIDDSQHRMPTADVTNRYTPIGFNDIINLQTAPRLKASFKMAFIVSAVPGSPNNNQQLHRIVVKPSDIVDLLPSSAKTSTLDARGPIREERIGAGYEVARFRWRDADKKTVEHIFGIDTDANGPWAGPGKDPAAQKAFDAATRALCINEDATSPTTGASLNKIARARAAAIYASLVDRVEGSATMAMNGGVHLSGWVNEITHEYTERAQTYTKIVFPPRLPEFNLNSFLSASDRAIALKLVQS